MRTTLLATSFALAAATAASATTIISGPTVGVGTNPPAVNFGVGDTVLFLESLDSGEGTMVFTFTADEALKLTNIAVSGLGTAVDLGKVSFAMDNGATGDSSFTIIPNGFGAFGGGFFDSFTMAAGETVNLIFTEDSTLNNAIQGSLRFDATAVPVPAALPLLAGALGGLALVRSRKTKS